MKKTIAALLVVITIAATLILLIGCVRKTEYDNKEIASIHYYTTESFMPWQNHQYYDFGKQTYSTKRIIMEGYDDPEGPTFEREDYEVKATFTEEQVELFFKRIKRHGIYNFEKNYHNRNIYDGNSWTLVITFADKTTFESGGYMKYPLKAKLIDKDFSALSGYPLFGSYAYIL